MRPTELIIRNYRSFAGEHRVELRPLTLIFGDNSAGKTALARALPLLADAVSPTSKGPLPLDSAAMAGSGFADLRFKGSLNDGDGAHLGLGLAWEQGDQPCSATFEFDREFRRIQVKQLEIEKSDTKRLELRWIPHDRQPALYDLDGTTIALQFEGLVPSLATDDAVIAASIHGISHRLSALHRRVQWLEALRSPAPKRSPQPAQPFVLLRPDGRDASQLAFADEQVQKRASAWFERNLHRELVLAESPPDELRTYLRRIHDPRYDVDLIDAGQGALQVFPVLVALATLRRPDGPLVLVIEEPESHLHAELQYELAREITAAVDPKRSIILETHSRPFFLGIQLEIIRGTVRPEDVIIHSVRQEASTGRSNVDRVELDADGMPSARWPASFFSSDAVLARELIMARRARPKSSP
ncbi:MAG: AAA family ATPase [Myxococcota bacterium]